MRCDFFRIACDGAGDDQAALNKHLSNARVLSLDRQFVPDGPNSFWSICIITQDAGHRPEGSRKKPAIDYREVLSPEQFAVYVRLRELRKTIATEEAIPPYSVFTNEQLAAMVTGKVMSKTALGQIPGIGAARLERYGNRFLTLISAVPALESTGVTS